jgi:osmotically-inducible protein OsmY
MKVPKILKEDPVFNFKKKDSQIQQDVTSELKWEPSVDSTEISVTANDGVVTLRGSVPHYYEKYSAEEAAERVGGVRAIADEIEVELRDSYQRSDSDIAEAALNALKWNYSAPEGIKVVVEKGWVILKGDADWDFERTAAKNAVSQLMGVRGVTNEISIKSRVQSSEVKTGIEEALKRSAESDAHKINVTVEGSQVTLSGTVHSLSEIEDARRAAWNAPGVITVEDKLKIVA